MRNLIAILAAAALLGPGSAMAASGAATLRGVAYVCGSDSVLPGAELRLIHQEDGRTISLRADANGRFVRVGLDPGTYTIVLMPLPENGWAPYFVASRVARFEADDVVDMRIGSRPVPRIIARAGRPAVVVPPMMKIGQRSIPPDAFQSHAICDPPSVAAAEPSTDRYILR